MAEVEHWMWRLFLDDLGNACASLDMQNVPFLNCSGSEGSLLPSPTPLLYGISPSLLQREPFWPSRFVNQARSQGGSEPPSQMKKSTILFKKHNFEVHNFVLLFC